MFYISASDTNDPMSGKKTYEEFIPCSLKCTFPLVQKTGGDAHIKKKKKKIFHNIFQGNVIIRATPVIFLTKVLINNLRVVQKR